MHVTHPYTYVSTFYPSKLTLLYNYVTTTRKLALLRLKSWRNKNYIHFDSSQSILSHRTHSILQDSLTYDGQLQLNMIMSRILKLTVQKHIPIAYWADKSISSYRINYITRSTYFITNNRFLPSAPGSVV